MADATIDHIHSPGWVATDQGIVWGADNRGRLMTMLATMALLGPDDRPQFKQPIPPADHEHIQGLGPCSCQSLWISGTMPPTGNIPSRPGVYVCFDSEARPAYIGTSRTNVKGRLLAHHRDPEKPALDRWLGFWPSAFSDSAAVWEIRLIEMAKPYLNRQHVESPPPVEWEPQGEQAVAERPPWYESDPYYQRYLDGPGQLFWPAGSMPWQVASMLRTLIDDEGFSWDEIQAACEITAARTPRPALPFPYMVGVLRQRAAGSR